MLKGSAALQADERAQLESPFAGDGAADYGAVAHIGGCRSIFGAQIVLIGGIEADAVGIAAGVAERIEAEQRDFGIELGIDVEGELILIEKPGGFDLVNGTHVAVREDSRPRNTSVGAGERRVDVAREKLMQAVGIDVIQRQSGVAGQLAFQAERRLKDVGRSQRGSDGVHGLRLRELLQRDGGGHNGEGVRVGNDVLLLADPVVTLDHKHILLGEAVIEDTEASADDVLGMAGGG